MGAAALGRVFPRWSVAVAVVAMSACTRTIVVQAPTTTTSVTAAPTTTVAPTTAALPAATTSTRPPTTTATTTVRAVAATTTTAISEATWYGRYGQLAIQADNLTRDVTLANLKYGSENVNTVAACQQLASAVQEARDAPPPPKPEARQALTTLLDEIGATCLPTGRPLPGGTNPVRTVSLTDYAAAAAS